MLAKTLQIYFNDTVSFPDSFLSFSHYSNWLIFACTGEEALHEYLRTKAVTVEY